MMWLRVDPSMFARFVPGREGAENCRGVAEAFIGEAGPRVVPMMLHTADTTSFTLFRGTSFQLPELRQGLALTTSMAYTFAGSRTVNRMANMI
jgi:hypothetical protein